MTEQCGVGRSTLHGSQRLYASMDIASAGIVQNLPIPCIVWKFPKFSVRNSANSLPVITVDAGFVEIRQHNGELHAL